MDYLKFNPKNQILVLNADYAPLNIVSKRKALLYVIKNKVQVLSDKVVRLLSYVRLPYNRLMANNVSRKAIFTRDQHTCAYCKAKENLTLDHILPQSRGGKNEWSNLITACLKCNLKKGNRTPKEADMKLLFEAKVPYNRMHLAINNSNNLEWKSYAYGC